MKQPPSLLHPSLTDESVFYISGPMTGKPKFNYPYFRTIATSLRGIGYNILSPAEIDSGAQLEKNQKEKPYSYWLKKAMLMMCNADAIIMLEGWTQSKGARRELDFMLDCGMPAFRLERHYARGITEDKKHTFGWEGLWLMQLDSGLEVDA